MIKKRNILSLLIMCCMLLTMMPTRVWADTPGVGDGFAIEVGDSNPIEVGVDVPSEVDVPSDDVPSEVNVPNPVGDSIPTQDGDSNSIQIEAVETFTDTIKVNDNDVKCTFKILPDNKVQIGNGHQLAIDEDINGELIIPIVVTFNDVSYTVTNIGANAFNGCSNLTGVIIPESVEIGELAFANCSNLSQVNFPDGVTYIGNFAFAGSGLEGILYLPDGLQTIGESAFANCRKLSQVIFPDSVTYIGNSAFNGYGNEEFSVIFLGINAPDLGIINPFGDNDTYKIYVPYGATRYNNWNFDGRTTPAYIITGSIKGADSSLVTLKLRDTECNYVTTNVNGFYSIPIPVTSTKNDYIIDVIYQGYMVGTLEFNLAEANSIVNLGEFTLTPTISGTIKGSDTKDGIPATLQLKDSSGTKIREVQADANGSYTISEVPKGTGYTIHVSCTGYESGTIPAFDVVGANVTGKDLTLTATSITYTITFDANGGSVTPTSATTGANGKLASLPVPSRVKHRFEGWFTAASGGTIVTTDTVFKVNSTIYAQWIYQGGSDGNTGGGNTGGGGGGSDSTPSPTPNADTFIFTPSKLTEMLQTNQAIQIENGLDILAKPQDIPRSDNDTIVIKASEIKDTDSLNAFYNDYPNEQALRKGYTVTFNRVNNGQSKPITQLNGKITLKFHLTAEEIRRVDPSTLVVYKESDDGAITPLTGTFDWERNTLSVTTDHLCNFYLMAQEGIPAQRLSFLSIVRIFWMYWSLRP